MNTWHNEIKFAVEMQKDNIVSLLKVLNAKNINDNKYDTVVYKSN